MTQPQNDPSNSEVRPVFYHLGQPVRDWPQFPSASILETFPNRFPHRNYWITFECSEFTSLCPVTGQPDFARLLIRYIPASRCIETKSLKFYLASYRSVPSFNEDVANRILEDLLAACQPRQLIVEGRFFPRGGIALTVEARWPETAQPAHSPQPAPPSVPTA